MIMDYQNLFSDSQIVTVTAASTNIVDLGADSALIQQMVERGGKILAQVDIAMTAGGTSLSVGVQVDDDVAFGSATTLHTTAVVLAALLIPGYQFAIDGLPPHISERYMRLYYTADGTFSGGGAISAGIILDKQSNAVMQA